MKKFFTFALALALGLGASAAEKVVPFESCTISGWEKASDLIKLSALDIKAGDFLKITLGQNVVGGRLELLKSDWSALYLGSSVKGLTSGSQVLLKVSSDVVNEITTNGFLLRAGQDGEIVCACEVKQVSVLPASDYVALPVANLDPTEASWKWKQYANTNLKFAQAGDVISLDMTADKEVMTGGNLQLGYGLGEGKEYAAYDVPYNMSVALTADQAAKITSSADNEFFYQSAKGGIAPVIQLYRLKEHVPHYVNALPAGNVAMGNWEHGVSLNAEFFAEAKAGDEIHVSLTGFGTRMEAWGTATAQVKLFDNTYNAANVPEVVIVLTDENIAKGKEGNAWLGGQLATITGVRLFSQSPCKESVTLAASGFATYEASFPVDYASLGLSAYAVTLNADKTGVVYTKYQGVVPANTPVLLKGAEAEKFYSLQESTGEPTVLPNDLKISYGAVTTNDDAKYYGFATVNGVSGFKLLKAGETLPYKKAYLALPKTAQALEFFGFSADGETTGLELVASQKDRKDAPAYNMAGQRVGAGFHGLVVKNGKKYYSK